MKNQDTNKRAEQIADAIGELPEQMICDALDFNEIKRKQRRKRRRRIELFSGLAAAILCIVVLHGSDRSLLQKQTADVDKTEEKAALKESAQKKDKKDVSRGDLDIWCMAPGMGEDETEYAYSGDQDQSTESSGVKKESGQSDQKESRGEQKNGVTAKEPEKDSAGGKADDAESAKSDSQDAIGDTEKNAEPLQAGVRQLLHTNITGEGENKRVQFTLRLGETGGSVSYHLKVSGLSVEMIARDQTAQNKIIVQGNTKSKITCESGTQIGCCFSASDMADGTVLPSITVTKENKDTGKKVNGEIKVEQKNGKYYLCLTEK